MLILHHANLPHMLASKVWCMSQGSLLDRRGECGVKGKFLPNIQSPMYGICSIPNGFEPDSLANGKTPCRSVERRSRIGLTLGLLEPMEQFQRLPYSLHTCSGKQDRRRPRVGWAVCVGRTASSTRRVVLVSDLCSVFRSHRKRITFLQSNSQLTASAW